MLAYLVIQPKAPFDDRVGAQGRSKGLADRTNLEQGPLADAPAALPIGDAIIEVVRLALLQHGNRHARDPVLLQQRLDSLFHYARHGLICRGINAGDEQQGPQCQQ